MAYDNPIPGFGTRNCINLRLWAAKPSKEFDLEAFNTGGWLGGWLEGRFGQLVGWVGAYCQASVGWLVG